MCRLIRNSRPKKNVCLTFRIFCCWRLDDVNIVGILCRSQKTVIFFRNFLCRHDFHKNCFCHKKLFHVVLWRFFFKKVWNTSISQIFLRNLLYRNDFQKKKFVFFCHSKLCCYFTNFWIISVISFNCSHITNFRKEFSRIFRKLNCLTIDISTIYKNYFTAFIFISQFFSICYDFWQKRWHPARRAQLLPPVAFTAFSGASMFWRDIQTFLSENERNGQSNESAD